MELSAIQIILITLIAYLKMTDTVMQSLGQQIYGRNMFLCLNFFQMH